MKRIRWLVFISMFGAFIYLITPTHRALAGDAVVSTCNFASLQTAVTTANSGGGVITFTCSGTITHTLPLIITANVTINGGGAITLNGNNASLLFRVESGASLTLDNLTLQNGRGTVAGAILNEGTLTVGNSRFINNATLGLNTTGGAISNDGVATIHNSRFEGNVTGTSFQPGLGGAIYNHPLSTLTISNSTFANNVAGGSGGAIFNESQATLTLTNSVLVANSANNLASGIYNAGILTLTHNSFAGHFGGGGVFLENSGTLTMSRNLISGTGACVNVTNNSTDLADNTCGDATVVADVGLAPFNGVTLPLLETSPALDAYPAPCAVATDQRGVARPSGGACDIGALEIFDTTLTTCDFASLSSAVTTANQLGGTITIACSGTIIFPSELTISANVSLSATGDVIFDGGDATRLFSVNGGTTFNLHNLTLQNGFNETGIGGGAIFSFGTVTISDSTFADNSMGGSNGSGGAIFSFGTVTISNSTFTDNLATSNGQSLGGAIYTKNGTLTISNSTFANNSLELGIVNFIGFGGAIYADNSTVSINTSTFVNNTAPLDKPTSGGAIFALTGSLTISNSTFTNNSAQNGAVIYNASSLVSVSNSTFVNNSASGNGGVFRNEGSMGITITHNTFVNNSALNGGLFFNNSVSSFSMTHNLIASGATSPCVDLTLNVNTTNLSNVACGSATVFANLGLGTFDGRVVPLTASSVAINRSPTPCAVPTDQLGNTRPFGFACDVGAVEFINPIFSEQEFLAIMQAESSANSSPIYPLVLDVIPNGFEVALRDGAGQIGTATVNLVHQNGVLSITIAQTTGIFGDQIHAHLPQLVMWTLDSLFAQAGIADIRIRQMTINPASISFEMGSP